MPSEDTVRLILSFMSAMSSNHRARRVRLPSSGIDSWTVIGSDLRPVAPVDEYLGWLTGIERSPNTVEAYARDLALFFAFLAERGCDWQADVDVSVLGEFAGWARRPARTCWCSASKQPVVRRAP